MTISIDDCMASSAPSSDDEKNDEAGRAGTPPGGKHTLSGEGRRRTIQSD